MFGGQTYNFFSLEHFQTYFTVPRLTDEPWFISFYFHEDESSVIHTREVENIWNALADAGGFYEIIALSAFVLLYHYHKFLFVKELSQKLYFEEAEVKKASELEKTITSSFMKLMTQSIWSFEEQTNFITARNKVLTRKKL